MANQQQQRPLQLHLPHSAPRRLGGLGLGWSKREWIIVAAAVAVIILIFSRSSTTPYSSSASQHSDWVPFTPLSNARQKAAFCLDGSVPGYHLDKGFGSGSLHWLLHIEGGGWCNTIASCSSRKRTALGSSKYMDPHVQFSGILSHDALQNPDFYNWNKVKIRYCDGASFAGHPEAEFKNGSELFFRGQLIWEALMDELLSLGLSNARKGNEFIAELEASVRNCTLICFVQYYDLDNQGQRDSRYTIVKGYTAEELMDTLTTTETDTASSTKDQHPTSSTTTVKRNFTYDDPVPKDNSKHADNPDAPNLSLTKPASTTSKKYRN